MKERRSEKGVGSAEYIVEKEKERTRSKEVVQEIGVESVGRYRRVMKRKGMKKLLERLTEARKESRKERTAMGSVTQEEEEQEGRKEERGIMCSLVKEEVGVREEEKAQRETDRENGRKGGNRELGRLERRGE